MKRILDNNTAKSLFKAPRGQKSPPPPPPYKICFQEASILLFSDQKEVRYVV